MIRFNGVECEGREENLVDLLRRHDIPTRGVAVAVNGEIVTKSQWSVHEVREGDVIEVVTAAAGG